MRLESYISKCSLTIRAEITKQPARRTSRNLIHSASQNQNHCGVYLVARLFSRLLPSSAAPNAAAAEVRRPAYSTPKSPMSPRSRL